jgi:RNA polymerase II elongation factor ELL
VARKAQLALNDMKISESDVAWTHVKSRNTSDRNLNGRAASPATAQTRASLSNTNTPTGSSAKGKRGVYSQEAKEQKSKTRPATKHSTVVLMKDESLKPRSSASGKSFELETRESNSNDSLIGSQPVTRRPGSGYKATSTTPQDSGLRSGSTDSRNSRQPNTAGSVNALRHDRVVQGQASRLPKPGGESEQEGEDKGKIRMNKVKSNEGNTDRPRDRKRMQGRKDKRGDVDRIKDRDGEEQREKIRERVPDAQHEPEKLERRQQRTPGDISSTGAKRKTSEFDDPTYEALPKINFQKKRRTNSSTTLASSPMARESRPRELPQKPELPHTTRESTNVKPGIKKELSPLPPSRNTLPPSPGKTTGSSSSSSVHRTSRGDKPNGASKFRRTSHIYTSSEDEAGPHQSVKREQVSASLPPAPPTLSPNQSYPHPSDHDALRKRYRISWQEYIATVAKVATQRSKIEAMLDRNGNISDSDGDVEMMDADELRRLSARHIALREELEGIIRVFEDQG